VSGERIFVETAGRLHFGVLDLRGARGRWFGGIGTAAPGPTLLVSARAADTLEIEGEDPGNDRGHDGAGDAARAGEFAERFLDYYNLPPRVHLRVHRGLPQHAGLGSGTQLALSVGRAIAELHGIDVGPEQLARAVGRAQRSAIGTWTFAGGGLVVEGGRCADRDTCGPLLARLLFPSAWRCVVAVPATTPGISGVAEASVLATLPPPSEAETAQVAHLVLMALLPAVADGDLRTFGASLTSIQEITGRWFASAQGGTFAPGVTTELIARMRAWGAVGVGQSSWGPAVYGVVEGQQAATELADHVRIWLDDSGSVHEGVFRREGARVWHEKGGL
jgi:beta-ribofuranosylaminobenzene 5'-phosphate synthase